MTIRFFSSRRNDPLLLLHGFAGHADGWREFAELAGNDCAVAAIVLPGHDPASPVPPGATFDGVIDAIERTVRREIGADIETLGYSMGGRIALGLLVRHPGLIRRATLVGASPGVASDEERRARATWDESWARVLLDEGIESFVARWEELPLFRSQRRLSPVTLSEQRRTRLAHDPRSLAAAMIALGLSSMPDYRSALPAIRVPVRLVAGEFDTKFRDAAKAMAALLPNAEVVVAPGAGHNVPLESPEFLARLVREP